ncbi:hypothetical protein NQ317_013056 [Molorchus minor]|uniref:Uncharacterized protein n=1 Tax=Molorchus minor TaxID=1323400 RepID=A0ABQ9K3F2_9CUCU|nr:hypothetical protein NQ317_013056 [Molorchus minor]
MIFLWAIVRILYYSILAVFLLKCVIKLTFRPCRSKVCLLGKIAIVTGGNRENSVKEVYESEEKIDILINNAGTVMEQNGFTKDGLHQTMQINTFGPFLLTHLLIAFVNNLTLENLNAKSEDKSTNIMRVTKIYANTKLTQLIISNEFAERLRPFGITSNAVHPGLVKTGIFNKLYDRKVLLILTAILLRSVLCLFGKTPEEGAQRPLKLAISNRYKNISGIFLWNFFMCDVNIAPPCVKNKEFRRQIWRQIEECVGLGENEIINLN